MSKNRINLVEEWHLDFAVGGENIAPKPDALLAANGCERFNGFLMLFYWKVVALLKAGV